MRVYILLFISLLIGLFGIVFSQNTWFGETNLEFSSSPSVWSSSLFMDFVVGNIVDTGFDIRISNPLDNNVSANLYFVNQVVMPDGKIGCDMVSGQSFGNNLLRDTGTLIVPANSELNRRVTFDYNACSSGLVQGCAVHTPINDQNIGSFDVVAGKANFLSFLVHPGINCVNFMIKLYPGSRPGGNYSNKGELRFYDINRQFVKSGFVENDSIGSGAFLQSVPSGIYYVVYKGQSHLASYLSGVSLVEGEPMTLDFTTGSNLYNIQNKSLATDDGNRYQIAGDMKNIAGAYDFTINGNDISSIVYGSGLVEGGIDVLDPKNLNGDTAINGADISVVGINFQKIDPFASASLFVW